MVNNLSPKKHRSVYPWWKLKCRAKSRFSDKNSYGQAKPETERAETDVQFKPPSKEKLVQIKRRNRRDKKRTKTPKKTKITSKKNLSTPKASRKKADEQTAEKKETRIWTPGLRELSFNGDNVD